MNARHFALTLGIIYTIVGVAGFLPPLLTSPEATSPAVNVDSLHGRLLGIFPVNILHTLVHLGTGLWALYASKSLANSVTFAKALAIIYIVLGVMGLIPGLNTLFGLVPLYGHDVWLHLGTAAVAAYFGFSRSARTETTASHHTR
jgi:hypothetical protein